MICVICKALAAPLLWLTMLTVVAIDDDPDDLVILKDACDEIDPNIRFLSFESGFAAVDWLRSNDDQKPNLVLIDFNMPHMNGIECLARLEKMPSLASSTLAILSTNISHMPADRATIPVRHLTIQKPANFRAYTKLLQNLIEKTL